MDSIISTQILASLIEGKYNDTVKFVAVFVFIWLEVRGLKKEVKKLNSTIADGFTKGEARFSAIEKTQQDFEHRLTVNEQQQGVTS